MDGDSWYCSADRNQDHPQVKEMQKSKMAVWGGLTNSCEKKRSKKQRRKGKICPFECRVPKNSKKRYESLPQWSMQRNRGKEENGKEQRSLQENQRYQGNISCKVKWSEVSQSCPTLCDAVDCTPPDSSVHGILQARILEWVTFSFSRGSSRLKDRNQVSRFGCRHFNLWATREAPSMQRRAQ